MRLTPQSAFRLTAIAIVALFVLALLSVTVLIAVTGDDLAPALHQDRIIESFGGKR